jgi:hypothetical protein
MLIDVILMNPMVVARVHIVMMIPMFHFGMPTVVTMVMGVGGMMTGAGLAPRIMTVLVDMSIVNRVDMFPMLIIDVVVV